MKYFLKRTWWLNKYKKFIALPWPELCFKSIPWFLVFAILWKGGKGLETTWLLTLLAWMLTFVYWKKKPDEESVPSYLWIGIVLFVFLTIASFLNSSTANYGLDEVLRTGSLALIFFWVIRNGSGADWFNRLVNVVVVTMLIAGIIGLFVYIFQPVNRFVGTFFDYRFHTDYWPNAWADLLLVTWPLVMLWALKEKRLQNMILRFLVVGLFVGFLYLSFSRGALISFVGQLILWAVIVFNKYWKKDVFPYKNVLVKIGIVFVVSGLLFSSSNLIRSQLFPVQSISQKATFTADEGASSVSERSSFWNQAWVLSVQKPLLGWGPYSFRFVQPRLQNAVLATSDHPHNFFLKMASERGWIAAILLLVIITVILVKSIIGGLNDKSMFIVLGIAGLMAHSLIDYNLQFVSVSLMFWVMLSLLVPEIKWGKMPKLNNKIVRFIEVGLATILLIVAITEARGILLSSVGRHLEAAGEGERALVWYDYAMPQIFSRDMHLSCAKILYELKRYTEAKSAVEDYMEENAEDFRGYKLLGDTLRSDLDAKGALDAYEKAYDLGGKYNDFGIMRAKVKLMMAAGQWNDVKDMRSQVTEDLEKFVDAIEHNTHFIALSPNAEEVIALANMYVNTLPNREKPLYEVLAARADHHSQVEREKIKGRAPGYLW
ncbi:O-antigen ligase family protein [Patescibacteria group bacterium]|nr:O-antigen ligase family protein [Patescibacteria group bacterium]